MSEETKIQWASSTWNPWIGCDKVSPGCKNCYIVTTAPFRTRGLKHGDPRQRLSENYQKQPAKWNKDAEAALRGWEAAGKMEAMGMPVKKEIAKYGMTKPERPRIFPSLCDWLDDHVPIEWLADFLKVIHDTPHLDWLLLTKRPENFKPRLESVLASITDGTGKDGAFWQWLLEWIAGKAPANVWFGISAESQDWLDKRWTIARKIPAWVHFVSAEPLLGPLDFTSVGPNSRWQSEQRGGGCSGQFVCNALTGEEPYYSEEDGEPCIHYGTQIDWVIVGGESGDGARPCSVEWIWDIQMQCKDAGVACFVKQLGALPVTENANIFDWPEGVKFEAWIGPGAASARLALKHPKGGDSKEWPEELRVREFPALRD